MLPAAHPAAAPLHQELPLWILQAEHLGLVVISEDFRVAAPIDHGIERLSGRRVAQMVRQLLLEPHPWRPMTGALVEHVSDVLRKRHRGE